MIDDADGKAERWQSKGRRQSRKVSSKLTLETVAARPARRRRWLTWQAHADLAPCRQGVCRWSKHCATLLQWRTRLDQGCRVHCRSPVTARQPVTSRSIYGLTAFPVHSTPPFLSGVHMFTSLAPGLLERLLERLLPHRSWRPRLPRLPSRLALWPLPLLRRVRWLLPWRKIAPSLPSPLGERSPAHV